MICLGFGIAVWGVNLFCRFPASIFLVVYGALFAYISYLLESVNKSKLRSPLSSSSSEQAIVTREPAESPKPTKASEVLGQFVEFYRLLEKDGFRFKDLQRLIQDADLRKRVVELCEPEEIPANSTVFQPQPLEKLIFSGDFGYVNQNITEANFPDIGVSMEDPKIYNFGKNVSSEYATDQMEKDGYRPANLRELLIWMLANWNGRDIVVALGQSWRDLGGRRRVLYLYGWDDERDLDLRCLGGGWLARCRFLAFRRRTSA